MGYFSTRKIVTFDVVTVPTTANDNIPEFKKLLTIESIVHPGGAGAVYKKFITEGAAANARILYNIAKTDPLIGIPTSNVISYSAIDNIADSFLAEVSSGNPSAEIVESYVTTLKPTVVENAEGLDYAYEPNYRGLQDIIIGEVVKTHPGVSYSNTEHSTLYPYNGEGFEYYEIFNPTYASTNQYSGYFQPHWEHEGMFSLVGLQPTTQPLTTVQSLFIFYRLHPDVLFPASVGKAANVRMWNAVNKNVFQPNVDTYVKRVAFTNRKGLDRPHLILQYTLSPTGTVFTATKDLTTEFTGDNVEIGVATALTNKGFGYLPIIPIREDWTWVEDDPDVEDKSFPLIKGKFPTKREVYKATKRIMTKTSFDLETLLESMQSTADGNDPSKMRSIYYGYFADTATDNPQTLKFLFEYFKDLENVGEFTKAQWTSWNNLHTARSADGANSTYAKFAPGALDNTPPSGYRMPYSQQNEVNVSTKKYALTLLYNYVTSTIKTGVIGSKGDVTKEIVPQAPLVFYESGRYKEGEALKGTTKELKGRGQYFLRKQLTANSYEEIEVHGLLHVYTPNWDTAIVRSTVDMAAAASGSGDLSRSVYIPIMYNHLNQLGSSEIAEVLADCSGYVVYAQSVTKVKWYQQASFLRLVQVVLVIVFAMVGLPHVGAAIAGGLGTIISLVVNILITYLLSRVIEIIVKELGLENSFIALVIMTIIAIAYPDSFTIGSGVYTISFTMLLASSVAATNKVINDNMASLQNEINKHEDLLEEKQKEIDDAVDLLASDNPEISYLLINKRPQYILDATPEIFYSRTVETIDFPNLSTEFVDSFHSRNLDLDILYR